MAAASSKTIDYADIRGVERDIPVDRLRLDKNNPRLSSYAAGSQGEILRVLVDEEGVDELLLSIAANGFYQAERLLVVPAKTTTTGVEPDYIVVEGNRRLAAVLILRDPSVAKELGISDVPRIGPAQREQLSLLPVSIFKERRRLWPYLGFRHVNGPREWDAFDKARFVAHVHEDYEIPIEEISRRIGDRFDFVARIYFGYRVVRQAEREGVFDDQDRFSGRRFFFSHIYTAVDQRPFQDFLGISTSRMDLAEPVAPRKKESLGELMLWIYGSASRGIEPVVRTQAPDLNTLREILTDPDALATLRTGRSLERALAVARGETKLLRDALISARESLVDASGLVRIGFKDDRSQLLIAEETKKLAEDIVDRMNRQLRETDR